MVGIKVITVYPRTLLVVGGYALAFHGYPRFTKDIDFWVWVDKKNAVNIMKALQ